jgi:hypothetical protein
VGPRTATGSGHGSPPAWPRAVLSRSDGAVTFVALAEKLNYVGVGHDRTVEQVVDLAVGEALAQDVTGNTPERTVEDLAGQLQLQER